MRPCHIAAAIATTLLLLATPAQAQVTTAGCESQPRSDRAVVYGVVQDSITLLPLQEVRVTLAWDEGGRRRTQQQETARDGMYRFCAAPVDVLLRVEAELDGRGLKSVQVAAGHAERVDLTLNAPKSAVTGRVVEHGSSRGIEAAEVRVRGTDIRAVTASGGAFDLTALPPGMYWLDVAHVAYQARQDTLRIRRGVRLQLTIGLASTVIPLRPIVVTVRSQYLERTGFYDRQERGIGTYLVRDEWQQRAPRYPSDVLRTVAGVRVVPRSTGAGYAVLDRGSCAFRYIMDGTRVGPTFGLDDVPIEWIEAIEIYRGASQIPAQFTFPATSPRANCGVIVIWTRNR